MTGVVNAMIMVHAIELALKNVGGNPKKIKGTEVFKALESIQNFSTKGLTTSVSYSANERRGAKGCKIVAIQNGELSAVTDFLDAPPVPEREKQGEE